MVLSCTHALAANSSVSLNKEERVSAVTAALIYNLIKYTKWEESIKMSDFNVCVAASKSLIDILQQSYAHRTINDHPIKIMSVEKPQESKDCTVLFISNMYQKTASTFLTASPQQSTLTISDIPYAIDMGYMIGFKHTQGRVAIEINLETMRSGKLTPKPTLIEIADRVIN